MKKITYILVAIMMMSTMLSFGEENIGGVQRKGKPDKGSFAAGCTKSTNFKNLDLNNVRCPIQMNGDMWWDLVNNIARYEIPKGTGKTSLFAGAIWIGGVDPGGNLKVAAQTYRQSGVDFWPGPLDVTSTSTTSDQCLKYDYHWKISRSDVQTFVDVYNGLPPPPGWKTPSDILTWPGNGDGSLNQDHFLAPYHDISHSGFYNPDGGDYPDFDLSLHPTCPDNTHLYGDQCIWWVFNDEGSIHTETGGAPIGLEIRAQAFDFVTNDAINDMTFYKYQIINRSKSTVNNTWFGAWVDPDLGYFGDDYVGCDVGRGLGYCYNGEPNDPSTVGYGLNPPAVGLDFFQGPIADPQDGIDNNRDGCIDCIFYTDKCGNKVTIPDNGYYVDPCSHDTILSSEQIIMSQFVYYNNDFSVIGNPVTATNYYNYLKGVWIDGTLINFGGSGHLTGPNCSFMFPGTTDPTNWGTGLGKNNGPAPPISNWTESTAGNTPGDRRFIQSAGKFTLKAGAVNYITTGAVWARTTSGGPLASVALLQIADDKAQALFDNCFAITNGPDAPDMTIRELKNQLIISIKPSPNGNDSIETNYVEKDPFIHHNPADAFYRFQGYQVFQLKDNSVSISDIKNSDKARLIFQCDIKDSVTQIVNQTFDAGTNAFVPTEEVNGTNTGITHTFVDTTDFFTNAPLVNHQTYYFTVIAYGYNGTEAACFDPYHCDDGHSTPYISGRRNVFTYTAVPHIPDPVDGGLQLNSQFGLGPKITRLQGAGNGGLVLDFDPIAMTQGKINELLSAASNYQILNPTYDSNHGPIDVQVYDPVKVGNHDFTVYLDSVGPNSKWHIVEMASGETDSSDQTIGGGSEKLFPQWGIKVNIHQIDSMAGQGLGTPLAADKNGFLEGTMTFSDNGKQWLTGVPDIDRIPFSSSPQNWILAGTDTCLNSCKTLLPPFDYKDPIEDPAQIYEKVITINGSGTWAPWRLTSNADNGPMYSSFNQKNALKLDSLASIDVILTSVKSKWSRSVVIEEQASTSLADGGAEKGDPRLHKSVDKNGKTVDNGGYSNPSDPNASDYVSATGMGWFPGYAVNLETGERLNIMFGEDSYLKADNGADMLFNPSSNLYSPNFNTSTRTFDPLFGGRHYIYVMGHSTPRGSKLDSSFIEVAYDNCNLIKYRLDSAVKAGSPRKTGIKSGAWRDCMWVGFPLLVGGHTWLESDVTIRLRMSKAYVNYDVGGVYSPADSGVAAVNWKNRGIPYYSFSTKGLAAQTNQTTVAVSALDQINVVPNPYYSHSDYEKNQVQNEVLITNLPNNCTVSIYTQNGLLVRRFNRSIPSSADLTAGAISQSISNTVNAGETSIFWDLKNSYNVPIAGGVYIIHINAPGLGEKVIKWFGVIRPIDLDTF